MANGAGDRTVRGAAAPATEEALSAPHRITTLPSGVRVVTERMPSVRSAALGFWIATGSAIEKVEQAGISHLLEHMLFRGTDSHSSEEIDQIFDAMGAEINAGTDKEATTVYSRVLDRHLERAFEVMGEMVFRPRLAELEAEREVVLEEIAMYEDDPQDRAFDALGGAVFGSHPLGRAVIGTAEAIGAVTGEQLRDFHARRYVPSRVVIAAAGSVEHEALVQMAERLPLAEHPSEEEPNSSAAPPDFRRRVRFIKKEVEQYHVCLGGEGPARDDERRFALRVLEGVLGATSSSRLFQEVRERRGLAYSVFSFSSLHACTGEVGVYVGTRRENLVQALSVISGELERCVRDPASEQELARSRENLKGRVVLAMESTSARMSHLGTSLLNGLPILSVDQLLERIDAVELGELQELAAWLFAPERMSVAAVGPDEREFQRAVESLAPVLDGGNGRDAAAEAGTAPR